MLWCGTSYCVVVWQYWVLEFLLYFCSFFVVFCKDLHYIDHSDLVSELRNDVIGRNHSEHKVVKPSSMVPKVTLEPTIAVLVIACNRVDYTKQTLDELLK